MRYLDTSMLVVLLSNEPSREAGHEWLGAQPSGTLAISDWVTAEFSSALARKLRMQRINLSDRNVSLGEYEMLRQHSLVTLPVDAKHFRTATEICDQFASGIRASDALHLAVAAANHMSLVTFDKPFAAGARSLGYDVELIA